MNSRPSFKLAIFRCLLAVLALQSSALGQPVDSLPAKRFGRGALDLGLAEATPWLVDRYIRNVDYTHISFGNIRDNLSPHSWAWDDDGFTTNQFGHPYHGSIFYNTFRSNGYSFWQSAPAAFAGSYIWETFGENQAPAPNDFINTGMGGIVLGEMTHRLAHKIIDERRRGFRRQASEVLALIIDPANGFDRIIDGRWGRVRANSGMQDSTPIFAELDLGMRKFRADHTSSGFGLYGHVRFLYGSPFVNYRTPFSYFSVNAELGKDDSSKLNIISVYGSLTGWRIGETKNSRHLALLSANYDFIHNEAFFYSGQSVKLLVFSEFGLLRKIRINTTIGGGPVILAAVPDTYHYEGRDYDYCTGIGVNGNFRINFADRFSYSINYRGGWLKTINGSASHYFLHAITSEFSAELVRHFSLCLEPGYFTLEGVYRHYANVDKTYPYLRASVRYTLNL
ncbi:MAG: DUF3943 domain-containing protein [Bacteroidota bacterium]|nr:DUF3943 domain-containing protein [Bacteroidota bacterium]